MFGDKIKELRKTKGLTQKEVAKKIGISDRVLSYYENNERFPDDKILNNIADFFKTSVDYLLEREDTVKLKNIPDELKEVGIEYIRVAKEMEEEGLSPAAIRELIEFAKKIKK